MATRPVFIACGGGDAYATSEDTEFKWHPGQSKSQKQKSIRALHSAFQQAHQNLRVLEVSTKSKDDLGNALSAFKLGFTCKVTGKWVSVESAFQGSKVFHGGGPFNDLYYVDSRSAKRLLADRTVGPLVGFSFYGQPWPLHPPTLFYDWLYMNCLRQNEQLSSAVQRFDAFTDIEFNPKRSINCQAYSVAVYVGLCRHGLLEEVLSTKEAYAAAMRSCADPRGLF